MEDEIKNEISSRIRNIKNYLNLEDTENNTEIIIDEEKDFYRRQSRNNRFKNIRKTC